VLAIADAFDAVQIPGVIGQEARDKAAYRILTVGAGTQFDPELVQLSEHCLQQRNLILF
jgi:response regulator RpfG family c-di-GMP phosphodiesterase